MSKLNPSGTATTNLTAPTAATVAALLEDSAGFIVCVYGKTNSGRSTFAQTLYGELSAAQLITVNLYDDAGAEAISQGWADYNDGKGAIIVLHAAGQMQALDGLYSTHRSVLVHEEGAEIALNAGSGTILDTSLLRATMRSAPERMPVGELKEDE
jgi:Flp pilus assembly CpaF family ATPase